VARLAGTKRVVEGKEPGLRRLVRNAARPALESLAEHVDPSVWFGAALDRLRPLLADPSVLKVAHNAKYDMTVLARHAISIEPYDDTLLLSFALDAGKQFNHSMDELSGLHLGHTPIPFSEVCGKGKSQLTFGQVPLRDATRYAGEDADVTLRLWHRFRPRLSRDSVTTVYERVDRPLVPVIAAMEQHGIKVDRAALAQLSAEFAGGAVTDEARKGLLGQGSILALTSHAERTSPVVRGKWILENILGTPPPPPPPDVPALKENQDGQKPRLVGTLGDSEELKGYMKIGDWNQVHLIARGNTLIHVLNGHVMAILIDDDTTVRAFEGLLGVQLEGLPDASRVVFRHIYIKTLQARP